MLKFLPLLLSLNLYSIVPTENREFEEWWQRGVNLIDTLTVPVSSRYSFAPVELRWFGDPSIFSDLNDFYQKVDKSELPPLDDYVQQLLDKTLISTEECAFKRRGILQYTIFWHLPKDRLISLFNEAYPNNILGDFVGPCSLHDERGHVKHNRLVHFLGMDGCMFFEPYPSWKLKKNECITMEKCDNTVEDLIVMMKQVQTLCSMVVHAFHRFTAKWFGQ